MLGRRSYTVTYYVIITFTPQVADLLGYKTYTVLGIFLKQMAI